MYTDLKLNTKAADCGSAVYLHEFVRHDSLLAVGKRELLADLLLLLLQAANGLLEFATSGLGELQRMTEAAALAVQIELLALELHEFLLETYTRDHPEVHKSSRARKLVERERWPTQKERPNIVL